MANAEYESIGFSQLREQKEKVKRLNVLSSVLGGDSNVSNYLEQEWYKAASAGICKIDDEIVGMYIAAVSNPNYMPAYIPQNLRNRSVSFMSFAVDDRHRRKGYGHELMKHFFVEGISSVKQELTVARELGDAEDIDMLNAIDHPLVTLETANPAVQYLYYIEASKSGYVFDSPLLDPLKQFRPIIVYMDTGDTQGQLIAEYKSSISIDIPNMEVNVPALRVQRDEFLFPIKKLPEVENYFSGYSEHLGVIYDRETREMIPGASNESQVRDYFQNLKSGLFLESIPLTYMENADEFRISCILPEDR